jgi:hypothetical protein
MIGKLNGEALLRFRYPLESGNGDFELVIAGSAYCNRGRGANPFHYAQIAFRHGERV